MYHRVVLQNNVARRILEVAEIATALSAFGYMALRAHWNFLGVTSMAGIGVDRYLMEVYAILAGELPFALFLAVLLAMIILPVRWVGRVAEKRVPRLDGLMRRLEARMQRLLPAIFLALLAVAQVRLLQVVSGGPCRMDVVLGDLHAHAVHGCYETAPRWLLFHAIVLLCVVAALLYARRAEERAWKAVGLATLLIALQLPTLYGTRVKVPWYPAARVETGSAAKPYVAGLLMLQTTEAVELWTVSNGRGEMVLIPREHMQSMIVADVRDLFAVARAAAKKP